MREERRPSPSTPRRRATTRSARAATSPRSRRWARRRPRGSSPARAHGSRRWSAPRSRRSSIRAGRGRARRRRRTGALAGEHRTLQRAAEHLAERAGAQAREPAWRAWRRPSLLSGMSVQPVWRPASLQSVAPWRMSTTCPGRWSSATPQRGPAAAARREQAQHREQQRGADERHHDVAENAAGVHGAVGGEQRQDHTAQHGAGKADGGVGEASEATAGDHAPGQRAGDQPDDQPGDDVMAVVRQGGDHVHRAQSTQSARAPGRSPGPGGDRGGRLAPSQGEQMPESLTVTDNRTGRSYELPIGTARSAPPTSRQIKVDDDDFGLLAYDPAFLNTASCRSRSPTSTATRHPPVPRLPDRAARRGSSFLEVAYLLIHGELPNAGRARRVGARHHHPHVRPRERQELHGRLPPRRPPDGDAALHGRRAVDVLPRGEEDPRRGAAAHLDLPADRQDADARGVRVPALARAALRLPGQRPQLRRATSST